MAHSRWRFPGASTSVSTVSSSHATRHSGAAAPVAPRAHREQSVRAVRRVRYLLVRVPAESPVSAWRQPVKVGGNCRGGGCGGGGCGGRGTMSQTTRTYMVLAVDGSPGSYPAPATMVSVRLLALAGLGANVGVTVAVAEPGANSTDVGETIAPVVASPLQTIVTVRPAVVSPVRVRTNCAGVPSYGDAGGHGKTDSPCRVAATVTEGSVCAPVVAVDSIQVLSTTNTNAATTRHRIAEGYMTPAAVRRDSLPAA